MIQIRIYKKAFDHFLYNTELYYTINIILKKKMVYADMHR